MKMISGWIGVVLIFLSLLLQLFLMFKDKNRKNHTYILITIQFIIILATIFWVVYAFKGQEIYWQTGISNIVIFIFNTIFLVLNIIKAKKITNKNYS